jgi:hypothetical protein
MALCATSGRSQASQRTEQFHDGEQPAHGGLHPARRTDFEEEARLIPTGVAQDVKLAPRHVDTVADVERPSGTTDPDGQGPGKHLHALVLASVSVARNPASGVEPNL